MTSSRLQGIMRRYEKDENYDMISKLILHAMQKAYYGVDPLGHYGLATEDYLHGTSPIRRYPDLVAHRAIKRELNKDYGEFDPAETKEKYQEWMEHATLQEQRADQCERDADQLKAIEYLENFVGETFEGKIVSIGMSGIGVQFENYVQGFIPRRNLHEYLYYGDLLSYVHKVTNEKYKLGEKVTCQLHDISKEQLRIEFTLVPKEKSKVKIMTTEKK